MNPKVFSYPEAEEKGLFCKMLDKWHKQDDTQWLNDYNLVCRLMEVQPELIKDYSWLEIFYIAKTGELPPGRCK